MLFSFFPFVNYIILCVCVPSSLFGYVFFYEKKKLVRYQPTLCEMKIIKKKKQKWPSVLVNKLNKNLFKMYENFEILIFNIP